MNRNFVSIRCRDQNIEIPRALLPIVGQARNTTIDKCQQRSGFLASDWKDSRTYQANLGDKNSSSAKKEPPKSEWTTENIRLARAVHISHMSQTDVKTVTNSAILILIEPRGDIVPKYKVRSANGVANLLPEKPFYILLYNFGTQDRKFQKGMVFFYATKHLLALVPIGREVRREIATFLHI